MALESLDVPENDAAVLARVQEQIEELEAGLDSTPLPDQKSEVQDRVVTIGGETDPNFERLAPEFEPKD